MTDEARALIGSALDRSLFVEAGAGTGKTTALVGRVVRLVATGRVRQPSGLVAITFTEAAAAELRDRIREALDAAATAPALPPVERDRCAEAVRRIDDATITTLHGFAQRLLADHPLEAGLPPGFEVEEGIAADLAFEARWAALRDSLLRDPDLTAELELGITLGLKLDRLREVTRALQDRWDRLRVAPRPPVAPAVLDPTVALGEVEAALAVVAARTDIGPDDTLIRAMVEPAIWAQEVRSAMESDDRHGVARCLAEAPATGWRKGSTKLWGDDKALVLAHMEAGCRAALDGVAAARRAILERLLARLAADTRSAADARRRAGRLHFHDLLVFARDLLWAGDPTVRAVLAARIDVLLVDEFQDTDPLQIELVAALAGADGSPLPRRWEEAVFAPGRVLVVGDPKQSIYGFRGADITLWARARALFAADDVVALTRNFRTVPAVIDWVNATFAELITEAPGLQPPYEALVAHRHALAPGPAVVVVGGPTAGVKAAEVRTREASELARVVAAMKADAVAVSDPAAPGGTRPVRFADVAVLVPTRTPIGALERAFDDADVPYRVESRSLVWATDIVRELLAVLRAVEDPVDSVAVVAALRSPGLGCTDDDLADWRRHDRRWDPAAVSDDDVAAGHPVAAGLAVLARLHRRRWWVPVDELIDGVVRELHLVTLTLAQRRPRDHHRRLRFVVDQARAFVEAGGQSLAGFLRWAARQTDQGATAVEVVVPEPDDDAVRILTVHGSKGLEFGVVILAGLGTQLQYGSARVLWGPDGAEASIGAKDRRFATGGYEAVGGPAEDAERAEAQRLLYVAATRARDHLVIGCHHKEGERCHAAALFARSQARPELWRAAEVDDEPARAAPEVGPPLADSAPDLRAAAEVATTVAAATGRPWSMAPSAIAAAVARTPDAPAAPVGQLALALDPAVAETVSGPTAPVVFIAADLADDQPSTTGNTGVEPGGPPDAPGAAPGPPRRGGTAVGRAVHGVLQTVGFAGTDPVPDAEIDTLAATLAAAEGIAGATAAVATLARSALASAAVAEARASRWWRELAVSAAVGDRLVEGYVDLLHETAEGALVVVDYKTDRVRGPDDLAGAVDRYRLQAAAYAVALEAATGRPVARCRFVFCQAGQPAEERDLADLPAAMAEVRAHLAR